MRTLLTLYAFIVGLCFGSFALATAWRIKKKKSFSGRERSICEHCKHQLAVMDLIPLYSWLSLGGKCRYCHKKLSPLLPVAELTGGVFLAASYLFWPERMATVWISLGFAVWCIGLLLLLILFFYDMQWQILPNKVMYPLWVVSAVSFLLRLGQGKAGHTLVMSILAVAVGAGFFWLLYTVSGGKWIGYGDVRLGLAIGLLLGSPLLAAMCIFVASLLGVVVALPGLVTKHKNLQSKIPYGPLLILGLVLVRLFGQKTIDWYTAHLLF